MHKVLIVEDDPELRDNLAAGLLCAGYRIKTAGNGTEAIEIGMRFRPDVLVADWLLAGHLDGLHVAQVLRVVDPELRILLMTGFSTEDLRQEAHHIAVPRVLEKPFPLIELFDSVAEALRTPTLDGDPARVAVLELDPQRAIVFMNRVAEGLLPENGDAPPPRTLDALFPPNRRVDLDAARKDWIRVSPARPGAGTWFLASRRFEEDGGWLVALHREGEALVQRMPIIRTLLGRTFDLTASLLYPIHVLIAEPDAFLRHATIAKLRGAGAICLGAGNAEEALRLFRRDLDVSVVIVDSDLAAAPDDGAVDRIRTERPHAVVVGTGDEDRRGEFAALGVNRFLAKPWELNDLVEVLEGE
jgi:DNA-binding response OmpR family regulator